MFHSIQHGVATVLERVDLTEERAILRSWHESKQKLERIESPSNGDIARCIWRHRLQSSSQSLHHQRQPYNCHTHPIRKSKQEPETQPTARSRVFGSASEISSQQSVSSIKSSRGARRDEKGLAAFEKATRYAGTEHEHGTDPVRASTGAGCGVAFRKGRQSMWSCAGSQVHSP